MWPQSVTSSHQGAGSRSQLGWTPGLLLPIEQLGYDVILSPKLGHENHAVLLLFSRTLTFEVPSHDIKCLSTMRLPRSPYGEAMFGFPG